MLEFLNMKRCYSELEIVPVAQEILDLLDINPTKATILALKGDLGAGKTTLVQSIANSLGVKEIVVSPTFVIAKWYKASHKDFENLVHIDAYRIESESELENLGFKDVVSKPKTLVVIEWPEKIENTLRDLNVQTFNIEHENETRIIEGPHSYEKK